MSRDWPPNSGIHRNAAILTTRNHLPNLPDPVDDGREKFSRHGNLGHLEDRVPRMTHYLRTDLDELLPERRHRPMPDRLGQLHLPEKVSEIVRQGEKLKPHRVVGKVVTGKPRKCREDHRGSVRARRPTSCLWSKTC